MTLTDAILTQNNQHFKGDEVFIANKKKGVLMHKIDHPTADIIAGYASQIKDLPLGYALACMAIEAIFDPNCVNGNLEGSNKENDPLGYDMGMCQIKLRFLPADMPYAQRRAYALNVATAIPHFEKSMVGHLGWAESAIARIQKRAVHMHVKQYTNKYFLATCAYNFGEGHEDKMGDHSKDTGMTGRMINDTEPASHGMHVIDLEKWFCSELNLPSVFQ